MKDLLFFCFTYRVLEKCHASHLDELRRFGQVRVSWRGVENHQQILDSWLGVWKSRLVKNKLWMSTANDLVDYGSSVHGWMISSDIL